MKRQQRTEEKNKKKGAEIRDLKGKEIKERTEREKTEHKRRKQGEERIRIVMDRDGNNERREQRTGADSSVTQSTGAAHEEVYYFEP